MKTKALVLAVSALFLLNGLLSAQSKSWVVPANFKSLKNPVAQSEASTKAGMLVFTKNCVSCHGKTGLGNGVKVATLKNFPGDFTKSEFQKLTDGEIFYRIKTGKEEMPRFEGKLSEDEIWNVINFLRTLKKK
jgi:mono/diheme cytochrome c family protein